MSRQLYWWCLFCLSTFIASLPFFRLSRLFFSSMLLLLFESQIGAKKVRGDTMGWNNIWRNIRILCVPFLAEESLFVDLKKRLQKKIECKKCPWKKKNLISHMFLHCFAFEWRIPEVKQGLTSYIWTTLGAGMTQFTC